MIKIIVDGYKMGGKCRSILKRLSIDDMVYFNFLFDYCRWSNKYEILGMVGWECKVDVFGFVSCREFCCRCGFFLKKEKIKE